MIIEARALMFRVHTGAVGVGDAADGPRLGPRSGK